MRRLPLGRRRPRAPPSSARRAPPRSGTRRCSPDGPCKAAGVNVDLAPVADVPAAGSFMAADQTNVRAYGGCRRPARSSPSRAGSRDAQVAATVKHFPGIGRATRNTDLVGRRDPRRAAARSTATSAPFRAAIAAGVPIVMISNASYPALDAKPAPWSPRVQALLRGELGFKGVTITRRPRRRGRDEGAGAAVGLRARRSGGRRPHPADGQRVVERGRLTSSLVAAAARGGARSRRRCSRSYDRIQALKARLRLRTAVACPCSLRSGHIFRRLT